MPAAPRLRFDADLELVVDGTRAHIRADGSTLIVDADQPAVFMRNARRSTVGRPRHDIVALAEALAGRGATLRIDGPSGPVLTMGAATDSRPIGVITGSRHLTPASAGAAASLLIFMLRSALRRLRVPWRAPRT